MDYSPLLMSFIALLIVFTCVNQAIKKEKFNKTLFFFCFFVLISTLIISYLKYANIFDGNDLFNYIYLFYLGMNPLFFTVLIYFDMKQSLIKNNHHEMFMKTLKESQHNIYYAIDKKERIIDISLGLCEELNIDKKDALGKKLTLIVNQSIRIVELNQNPMNNKQFESYFQDYKKLIKKDDIQKMELKISNYKGEESLFHLTYQPIFIFGKYRGYTAIGEKKSNWELLEVEKSLKDTQENLESVSQKFISILEVTSEGLFEMDLDTKTIWASDELVKFLNLPDNTCDLLEFRTLMNESDRSKYLAKIGELTKTNPYYQFSYRIFNGKEYQWFKESGKRIFDSYSSSIIMGVINPIANKHFQSSNIDVLDTLTGFNEMIVFMKDLFLKGKYFQLMLFDLVNLKHINETHDRAVGNMIMGEYIKKIKQNFVTESGNLFRITGTIFALILTNTGKISVLEKGVKNQKDYLNYAMSYGSLSVTLEVFAGIASSGTDAKDQDEIYACAQKALKLSKHEKFDLQTLYYKDL